MVENVIPFNPLRPNLIPALVLELCRNLSPFGIVHKLRHALRKGGFISLTTHTKKTKRSHTKRVTYGGEGLKMVNFSVT